MKILRLFVVLAALLCAGVVAPSPARARDAASFDFFYDALVPYGEWIQLGDYGPCWRPTGVDPDWSPYSDGYWAYTDAGWTWVSYEEFGGIVYHYGRWVRLEDEGWCWVPDYEWAPAWVSWRASDDYVGWAPLPPEARWQPEVGISVWADSAYDIGPGYYSFCRVRDFGEPVLRGVIINREENVTIIRDTENITNITYNSGFSGGRVIYNGGPQFAVINRFSARPVPSLKLVQNTNFDPANWRNQRGPGGRNGFNAQTVGNQLIVAAPLVVAPSNPAAFRGQIKRAVTGEKVSHGWSGVKNPEVQKELRQEIQRQSKGLTPASAPARAVAAADLKAVPEKADPNATPATGAKRGGKGPRPESVVVQPNNLPPNAPAVTPFVKPTAPVVTATPAVTSGEPAGVARERGRMRNSPPPIPPTASVPNLKPFNPVTEPKQQPNAPAAFTPTPRGPNSTDTAAQERAAEQARIRAEQERNAQQKQAAAAAQQQKQAEMAAQQQKQAVAQQQKQAEMVAQQKQAAAQQQKQAEVAAQQQRQIAAQQEAARAAELRRRQIVEQPRQQAPQQPPQQQRQPPPPPQPQRQPPPQPQHQPPPQPQPQPNQPSPHPSKDSKDSKDKDKKGN